MKTLIAPLNWGLGHATRCIPIVRRLLQEGNEVVLGGNGDSLMVLRQHFPELRWVQMPDFEVRYSSKRSQVGAMIRLLPQLIRSARADYLFLEDLLHKEHFDRVVSDNRFGLWNSKVHCIYMTHQLMVKMPQGLQWAERLVWRLHGWVIGHYDACWVPDVEEGGGLSGDLSHKYPRAEHVEFIGPLSRFMDRELPEAREEYDVVAVLSGVEPQRSLLEAELIRRYEEGKEQVLVVRGKVKEGNEKLQHRGKLTLVSQLADEELAAHLLGAKKIIARSGYSSIMDFAALGVMSKVELIATPGQTEQEYLQINANNADNANNDK